MELHFVHEMRIIREYRPNKRRNPLNYENNEKAPTLVALKFDIFFIRVLST